MNNLFHSFGGFVKKNVVMMVAFAAALVTCFFVPPDEEYWGYLDAKTLTCLFCVLAVVCALKNVRFFYILARRIVQTFKNTRMSILALVYITFLGSMLIANDMALLTFLPLGLFVLSTTGKTKYMAFTFIMQNIAANLGGMLTPFGNPQNLYLYTKFEIPNLEFMAIMAPPFALAVVCALKNVQFFYILAKKIVQIFRNTRLSILALVYITFIGSMLIANDMALLTFLPLGLLVLTSTGKGKYMAFTFIMQNIAANLGGMLTPFGNPQNLYLYTKFEIPNLEFMSIMAPPFVLAVVLITICCILFVKPEPLELKDEPVSLPVGRTVVYLLLFALAIAIVFRGIPYWIGLVIIPAVLIFMDRQALKMVDYPLLLTFVFFFIFSGNMARIDVVKELFSWLLGKSTLLFSVASCQVISNVPSAILLSQFTDNYRELLLGVNIGGVGTLIASLASLITFREYTKQNKGKTGYYMALFTAFNFAFLIILAIFVMIF